MDKKAIGQLWSSHHVTFSQMSRSPGRCTLVCIYILLTCIFAEIFSFVTGSSMPPMKSFCCCHVRGSWNCPPSHRFIHTFSVWPVLIKHYGSIEGLSVIQPCVWNAKPGSSQALTTQLLLFNSLQTVRGFVCLFGVAMLTRLVSVY